MKSRFTELGTEISGAPTVPHSQIRLILQTLWPWQYHNHSEAPRHAPCPLNHFCIRYCHGSYPRLIDQRGTLKHLLCMVLIPCMKHVISWLAGPRLHAIHMTPAYTDRECVKYTVSTTCNLYVQRNKNSQAISHAFYDSWGVKIYADHETRLWVDVIYLTVHMVSRLYSVVYTPCYSVHIQTYMDCMHSIESFNRSEICTILRSWCLLPHQFNNGTSIPYPPFSRAIQSDSNNIKHSRTSLVISPRI